jgi:hypothetical protein
MTAYSSLAKATALGTAGVHTQRFVMDRVKLDLKHCFGIKKLKKELDFTKTRAYAIYAAKGVMKSSLANTFQDAANSVDSEVRVFPARPTSRKIIDETARSFGR